jgi:hypothetical protein
MNNKYYIIDQTLQKDPFFYDTLPQVVKHLEGTVIRAAKKDRKHYMEDLADFGFGPDDASGVSFTDSVAEHLGTEIGLVKQGKLVRCNIHEATLYSKYSEEMGD